jgi:polar amino acid ABC transporter
MRKNLLLGCVCAISVFLLAACSGGSTESSQTFSESAASSESTSSAEASSKESKADTAAIDADGVFTVGFDQDFPPMGFVGDDGEFTGFDLELAAEVAKRLGMEIKYQPIAWDAKEMEIESGNIDVIWNGFTTNGRENDYTWSKPYMENKQVFVVSKDSGITKVEDLKGKKVEVQVDSSGEKALTENKELSGSFAELITTADYNTAFQDLEMGATDAVAMDIIVAGYQLKKRGDGKYIILEDEPISTEEYGIGFKKGNTALRDAVDATLVEMAADKTLKSISEKWFDTDVTIIK